MSIDTITESLPETTQLNLLTIQIEQEHYALPAAYVREVARYQEITPVPGAPESLPGIINNHGTIIPVANLRLILHFSATELTRAHRLVICHYESIDLALLVDRVIDLSSIASDRIEPIPSSLDATRALLLQGVVLQESMPVALIDLKALITILRDWA